MGLVRKGDARRRWDAACPWATAGREPGPDRWPTALPVGGFAGCSARGDGVRGAARAREEGVRRGRVRAGEGVARWRRACARRASALFRAYMTQARQRFPIERRADLDQIIG